MIAERVVRPEILDDLPADDPRARGSRRDLDRINRIMRHVPVVAATIRSSGAKRVLEIGSGDGRFLTRVLRRLGSAASDVTFTLLDRAPIESARRAEIDRVAGAVGARVQIEMEDAFAYLREAQAPFDLVVANLFLHHFEAAELGELFRSLATSTRGVLACEPLRSPGALHATRGLGFIGCNAVTRHDAKVSVEAGFRGDELSAIWRQALGDAKATEWRLHERVLRPFSHVFHAERIGGAR